MKDHGHDININFNILQLNRNLNKVIKQEL
jgi:hypothetical protein